MPTLMGAAWAAARRVLPAVGDLVDRWVMVRIVSAAGQFVIIAHLKLVGNTY
jgi:hypothetical protein